MGIEETVARLRSEEADARQRHASALAGAAQARGRADAAREDLAAEFGISTVAEAREALAGLTAQLEAEAAEVRRLLDQAGGTQ